MEVEESTLEKICYCCFMRLFANIMYCVAMSIPGGNAKAYDVRKVYSNNIDSSSQCPLTS